MTGLIALERVTKRFWTPPSLVARLTAAFGSGGAGAVVHAVEDVSLEIAKGEVVGLVGESGCGKSTLGRVIAGILPPSTGRALLDGAAVMSVGDRPVKATTRVQMIFQDPFASLDPRMRVGDIIAEGPLAHGLVPEKDAKSDVAKWLVLVGLEPAMADRYPHQFSGGQRQRVAIARALAMRPEVLICDEPVASLDVSIQAQIVNLFLKLRRELGLTMLFISHDLSLVRHLSDRVAIMYLGRIVELGRASEVFATPRHPYTKALLDSAPRLRLNATDQSGFQPIRGELPSPLDPPAGCHFHLRCPHQAPVCRDSRPQLTSTPDGRSTACHFPFMGART